MIKIFLFLILSISFIYGEDLDFLDPSEGSIIIEAQGFGNSPTEAKKNALQELVFQIRSSIDTSIETSSKVSNSKYSKTTVQKLNIKSNGFFEALHYSDVIAKNDYYQIKVVITQKSLKRTLERLYQDITKDVEKLNVKEQQTTLEKINILKSLLPYSNNKIDISYISQSKLKAQEIALKQVLNMSKIIFHLNVKNAKITIDDKTYTLNDKIFVKAGKHHYIISANGFYSEKGNFYTEARKIKNISKTLISKNINKLKVYISTDNEFDIKDDISTMLSKYSIKDSNSPYATNAFKFYFKKEFIANFGNAKFYKLSLVVKAYRGKQLFITKKATIKRVAQVQLKTKAKKLAKAITKSLLKNINIKEFKGNSIVLY